jgi:hypothetical protein
VDIRRLATSGEAIAGTLRRTSSAGSPECAAAFAVAAPVARKAIAIAAAASFTAIAADRRIVCGQRMLEIIITNPCRLNFDLKFTRISF